VVSFYLLKLSIKGAIKMTKDIHGLLNTILGTLLALLTGIYGSQIPSPLFFLLIVASGFLIIREAWVYGGRVKWSLESINRKH
jgi:hypothetical protein